MPTLTVEGVGEFEVAEGKRLVLALTDDAGVTSCTPAAVKVVARPVGWKSWRVNRMR